MIPGKDASCWRKLARGEIALQTQTLGLQLILKRVHKAVAADPGGGAVEKGAEDIWTFFSKYECILANEIQSLKG